MSQTGAAAMSRMARASVARMLGMFGSVQLLEEQLAEGWLSSVRRFVRVDFGVPPSACEPTPCPAIECPDLRTTPPLAEVPKRAPKSRREGAGVPDLPS